MRRNSKQEITIVAEANDMIRQVLAQRPSNPADTQRIIVFAMQGGNAIEKAHCAIATIVSGPHADSDYLVVARMYLDEARHILSR